MSIEELLDLIEGPRRPNENTEPRQTARFLEKPPRAPSAYTSRSNAEGHSTSGLEEIVDPLHRGE